MKAFITLLICFSIVLVSGCKDDSEEFSYDSTGIISGSDKAQCACCGGWILTIDNDSKIYRIEELPEDAGIVLNEDIIHVKFNWNIDRECASIIYVNIEDIALN